MKIRFIPAIICYAACVTATETLPSYDLYGSQTIRTPEDIQRMSCAQCHGDNATGYGPQGEVLSGPQIAGLPRGYMIQALQAYQRRNGQPAQRYNPKMNAVVAHLPPLMFSIYAQLYSPMPTHPVVHGNHTAQWQIGEHLWTHGDPHQQLSACMSCHGLTGRGLPNIFPPLYGQKASYIIDALHSYQRGYRQGFQKAMTHIATQLSEEQIQAIALYLSQ